MENKSLIFQSLEIIEKRITERLTVESIASGVYLSKYHYQRLFREIVGDSVMEYVTKRKLSLAGRVLLETNTAILDIALDYGYDSRDSFSRSFKAHMGVTPTEYRKNGLAAITQKTTKERLNMTYSKSTDEIIRGLNEFVKKAKEIAKIARKAGASDSLPQPFSAQFWNNIANETDLFADKAKFLIDRIASLTKNPDEITNRFSILDIFDETMFKVNVLTLHVNVTMLGRMSPEHAKIAKPICDMYTGLARTSELNAQILVGFLRELASLVIEDIKKTATQKIKEAALIGRTAADHIIGYDYIKDEIERMVNGLSSTPLDKITLHQLDDYLLSIHILSFSIMTDALSSNGTHKTMFEDIETFRESLKESADFLRSIKRLDIPERKFNPLLILSNIAFQNNILLFYLKSEISHKKLGSLLDDEQIAAFGTISSKFESVNKLSLEASDRAAFKEIANRLSIIHADMTAESDKLKEHGGAVKLLADTVGKLADKVKNLADYTTGWNEDCPNKHYK